MDINVKITGLSESTEDRVKGYASIKLDDCIVIHEVCIVEGKYGLFASMPRRTRRNPDGNKSFSDIVHPINSETREKINKAVVEAYMLAVKENEIGQNDPEDIQE